MSIHMWKIPHIALATRTIINYTTYMYYMYIEQTLIIKLIKGILLLSQNTILDINKLEKLIKYSHKIKQYSSGVQW